MEDAISAYGALRIPQEVYRIMREAIHHTAQQSGRLFQPGQEAHYMALAAAMSLKAVGYSIEKSKADA